MHFFSLSFNASLPLPVSLTLGPLPTIPFLKWNDIAGVELHSCMHVQQPTHNSTPTITQWEVCPLAPRSWMVPRIHSLSVTQVTTNQFWHKTLTTVQDGAKNQTQFLCREEKTLAYIPTFYSFYCWSIGTSLFWIIWNCHLDAAQL